MKVTVNVSADVSSKTPMSVWDIAIAIKDFSGKSFTLDVEPTMIVADLKTLVNGLLQVDPALNVTATLLEKDVLLTDSNTLAQADVQDGDVLTCKIVILYL
jgi:uncharacterized ubiquitin-like protein YukD